MITTHAEWKKLYKDCQYKKRYQATGNKLGGGSELLWKENKNGELVPRLTNTQCTKRASQHYVGFCRCMYSKCPLIVQEHGR